MWDGRKSWNGVAILSHDLYRSLQAGNFPAIRADRQARYIEAAVDRLLIGCLYLPNGNPQPGSRCLRLDHLLLSKVVASCLVEAGVDGDVRAEENASDHAPAWIKLKR